jgi:hypothetical protein
MDNFVGNQASGMFHVKHFSPRVASPFRPKTPPCST